MALIRQILTDWTMASGTGKASVMFFDALADVDDQRSALGTFWGAVDGALDNSASWTIENAGVELEDTDGELAGAWSAVPAFTGVGAGNDNPVSDASQALVRWKTGEVIDGRFLQGRQFIPGLGALNITNGNLGSVSKGIIQGAANALIAAGVGLCVWHRPIRDPGGGPPIRSGTNRLVTTAAVWDEMAVLRRRRG